MAFVSNGALKLDPDTQHLCDGFVHVSGLSQQSKSVGLISSNSKLCACYRTLQGYLTFQVLRFGQRCVYFFNFTISPEPPLLLCGPKVNLAPFQTLFIQEKANSVLSFVSKHYSSLENVYKARYGDQKFLLVVRLHVEPRPRLERLPAASNLFQFVVSFFYFLSLRLKKQFWYKTKCFKIFRVWRFSLCSSLLFGNCETMELKILCIEIWLGGDFSLIIFLLKFKGNSFHFSKANNTIDNEMILMRRNFPKPPAESMIRRV